MADKRTITPEEKALLQAKHRQEEAEARNRKKERDARTHRLVQEGAILESIVPHIKEMDLDSLKRELMIRLPSWWSCPDKGHEEGIRKHPYRPGTVQGDGGLHTVCIRP